MWWWVWAGVVAASSAVMAALVRHAPLINPHIRYWQSDRAGVLIYNCDQCGAAGLVDETLAEGGGFVHTCPTQRPEAEV